MEISKLSEEELCKLIDEKNMYIKENELTALAAQSVLDEITELRSALNKIQISKLSVTPVLNAPLRKDRPKESKSHYNGNRLSL